MPIRRLILLIIAAVSVLAACGGAPAPQSASSLPTAARTSSVPTAAIIVPTAAPSLSTFEGLSTRLDNSTQARIRATNVVVTIPNMDVYINGLPAFNGGKPQQDMNTGVFSGWLYVTPGTYTVALVPHGGTLAQALFAPVAVNVAAGHRYTVAAVGQLKEKNVKSLVIDETALIAGIGATPTDDVWIDVNNVIGVASIDEQLLGKAVAPNLHYDEARAYLCPIGRPHAITFVTGQPAAILGQGDNTCEPATSVVSLHYGAYALGNTPGSTPQGTSELNTLDFLAGFNRYKVATDDGHVLTFNTLLAAIDTAGLRDLFASSDPYFFFAPTDEAFAALPSDKRAALLNDPQALTTLIKTHFIPGYYPYGTLFSASAAPEITNVLGQKLRMTESGNGVNISGVQVLGVNYTVANGNRVHLVNKLLPVK